MLLNVIHTLEFTKFDDGTTTPTVCERSLLNISLSEAELAPFIAVDSVYAMAVRLVSAMWARPTAKAEVTTREMIISIRVRPLSSLDQKRLMFCIMRIS